MRKDLSRRSFINRGAMTGMALAVGLEPLRLHAGTAPTLPPQSVSFDADWEFCRGDIPDAQLASSHSATWRRVTLPHDWSIEGPYSKDEPSAGLGGYLPTGIAWYRKSFHLPRGAKDRHVRVQFDGVYQRSEVWINGHSLGFRPYGYISFQYDLTPYLRHDNHPNLLAVRVDNSLQPNARWYTGSGIYRHVWLIDTHAVHIAPWGTMIRTPSITQAGARVAVSTRVLNELNRSATCRLTTAIADPSGAIVQTQSTEAQVAPGQEHLFDQMVAVDQPALWSHTATHLYTAQQTLTCDGADVQAQSTAFGIREILFDVDRGFLLNGEHVKLNGVCLHADGGAVGAAIPLAVWRRRLLLLKAMGCNAIRCSHNPPAPEFLDLCDTIGFLVMDEAYDEWREAKAPPYGYHKYFDEWGARDLTDMIVRDRNHPSIVIWSAGNEVPDQLAPAGPETLRKLMAILHTQDPTRPVTVACDHVYSEPKSAPPAFLDLLDIVGYNYVGRWGDRREKYYSIDRRTDPQRRMIGTENVAFHGARGAYRTDIAYEGRTYHASNGRIEVEQLQRFTQTYDYVSGDFMWTGIDYLGESRWPNKLAISGALDTCGFPKDAYYFYQSIWTQTPMLHLAPHWNWSGKEGEIISVICYTNCDTVELFLNGRSLGVKGYDFPQSGMVGDYNKYPPRSLELVTTGDLHLSWDVVYQPGTLKAVGMKQGQVVQVAEVSTTGAPSAVRLTLDDAKLTTSREEIAHVKVEIIDGQGRMVPTANDPLTFAINGAGRILALDNGQPDSHESYQGTERRAFNGMALALLQSTGSPGPVRLTASAPGLRATEISVNFTAS